MDDTIMLKIIPFLCGGGRDDSPQLKVFWWFIKLEEQKAVDNGKPFESIRSIMLPNHDKSPPF